jgi:superfamily II DNA or RNA helicase
MNIASFLPKYPNIDKNSNEILNPYEGSSFNEAIFRKKEFYENRLLPREDFPEERGQLMKYQKTVANFLSSHTPYDQLLLVHSMGTGKTCSAIGAIEQIRRENSSITGAYIFAKGTTLLTNFIKELRDKCTEGQYIPEGYIPEKNSGCGKSSHSEMSDLKVLKRTKKLIEEFYNFSFGSRKPTTYETFAKHIKSLSDNAIKRIYSNNIFILDEVHNLRDVESNDKNKLMQYKQFHRFLHLVNNSKILLLTGTPMRDSPGEIASVMNLILPTSSQLPAGKYFMEEYMESKSARIKVVKESKVKELQKIFRGRVSYLRAMSSQVSKKFIGKKVGSLSHMVLDPYRMSDFQTKQYLKSLKKSTSRDDGIYLNARQSSLFVFPDGSYGSKGFKKWVEKKVSGYSLMLEASFHGSDQKKKKRIYNYSLNTELIKELQSDGKEESKVLKRLKIYSVKYAAIIENILKNPKKSCFVYSGFVTGSGVILFSLLLKLFGFKSATGYQGNSHRRRYGLLTNNTSSPSQIAKIITCFNQPENKNGEIIQVIIGSPLVSEGVSLYNIQDEYIISPWFNYAQIDQAIARGYRLGSHRDLIKAGIKPEVRVMQMVALPSKKSKNKFSIDVYMYEISEDKDISIQSIIRIIMESSFDCSINYFRNIVQDGVDGSKDCNYQLCDYSCDGVDMKGVVDGLSIDELDYSTYKLYYADPKVRNIRENLTILFRKNKDITLPGIIDYFGDEYTEFELRTALKTIISKDRILRLKDYTDIYIKSAIGRIELKIEDYFRHTFRSSWKEIKDVFPDNVLFDVITGLNNIIYRNTPIVNKYGFISYLRESNDIYFLVDSLTISSDPYSDYYTRVPTVLIDEKYEEIIKKYQLGLLPDFINKMCNSTDKLFIRLLNILPLDIQEMFIEIAVLSLEKPGTDIQKRNRKLIFNYYANYIHKIGETYISSRDEDNFRCLDSKEKIWSKCTSEQVNLLEKKLQVRKSQLENNKWGYYAKYNPQGKNGKPVFSIVDLKEEKKKIENTRLKKEEKYQKLVDKGKMTLEEMNKLLEDTDYRNKYPGMNCRQGWGVSRLLRIGLKSLKLPYPQDFKIVINKVTYNSTTLKNNRRILIKLLSDYLDKNAYSSFAKTIRGRIKNSFRVTPSQQQIKKSIDKEWEDTKNKSDYMNKAGKELYTLEEIKKLELNDLLRAVYYIYGKENGKSIKSIEILCVELEKWFRNNTHDGNSLLVFDNEIGTTGGHTKKHQEKKSNMFQYRLIRINPSREGKKFEFYHKNIKTLMKKCGVDFKPVDNEDINWILLYPKNRKKMSLLLSIRNNGVIRDICLSKGVGSKEIEFALKNGWLSDNKASIELQNTKNDYGELLGKYESYGFKKIFNDGHITKLNILFSDDK